MRKFILYILFFSFSANAIAQDKSSFTFSFDQHDFGNIEESKGKVTVEFQLNNTGTQAILISNVQASCGCTTPSWTKAAIQPGYSGYIKATYDPTNRPGIFKKNLLVTIDTTTNGTTKTHTLSIAGNVIPIGKVQNDQYPYFIGNLRFSQEFIQFGEIKNNKTASASIKIKNDGDQMLLITSYPELAPYFKIEVNPMKLNPKDSGEIIVRFDPKMKNDWGYITEQLSIETNDSKEPNKKIWAVAVVKEYFPPLAQMDTTKLPRITTSKFIHDFGTIQEGDIVTTDFEIVNSGKGVLKILKTKASCGCTAAEPGKKILKPGEKTILKVTFDSKGKKGKDRKTIIVYTNDPFNPEASYTIRSTIQGINPLDTNTIKSK